MPMTKAEKAVLQEAHDALERAMTRLSLHSTLPVSPDIPPPSYSGLTTGWLPVGVMGEFGRVECACSSNHAHGTGVVNKTSTQDARHLYSTKLRALQAMRYEVEQACAAKLRRIDKMIEAEQALQNAN